jgi:hypothetical protein
MNNTASRTKVARYSQEKWNEILKNLSKGVDSPAIAVMEGISIPEDPADMQNGKHYQWGRQNCEPKIRALTQLNPKPRWYILFLTGGLHCQNEKAMDPNISDEEALKRGKAKDELYLKNHESLIRTLLEEAGIGFLIIQLTDYLKSKDFGDYCQSVTRYYNEDYDFQEIVNELRYQKVIRTLNRIVTPPQKENAVIPMGGNKPPPVGNIIKELIPALKSPKLPEETKKSFFFSKIKPLFKAFVDHQHSFFAEPQKLILPLKNASSLLKTKEVVTNWREIITNFETLAAAAQDRYSKPSLTYLIQEAASAELVWTLCYETIGTGMLLINTYHGNQENPAWRQGVDYLFKRSMPYFPYTLETQKDPASIQAPTASKPKDKPNKEPTVTLRDLSEQLATLQRQLQQDPGKSQSSANTRVTSILAKDAYTQLQGLPPNTGLITPEGIRPLIDALTQTANNVDILLTLHEIIQKATEPYGQKATVTDIPNDSTLSTPINPTTGSSTSPTLPILTPETESDPVIQEIQNLLTAIENIPVPPGLNSSQSQALLNLKENAGRARTALLPPGSDFLPGQAGIPMLQVTPPSSNQPSPQHEGFQGDQPAHSAPHQNIPLFRSSSLRGRSRSRSSRVHGFGWFWQNQRPVSLPPGQAIPFAPATSLAAQGELQQSPTVPGASAPPLSTSTGSSSPSRGRGSMLRLFRRRPASASPSAWRSASPTAHHYDSSSGTVSPVSPATTPSDLAPQATTPPDLATTRQKRMSLG